MVDSLSKWAGSTLLQSQNYATKTTTAAQTQSAQQSSALKQSRTSDIQEVFDDFDKILGQSKSLMKSSGGVMDLASSGGTNADLPRGSLIDIVV